MKVFITGANGFIGSKLCEKFLDEGAVVYGLVRQSSDLRFIEGKAVQLIKGDLNDPSSFSIPDEIDCVIHSASTVSDTATDKECKRNILGMTQKLVDKIIESGIALNKFIYISTTLVLGYGRENISDEKPGFSAERLPYTKYKIETERYLTDLYRTRGFPAVIIRPSDVMGPNDRTSSEKMLTAALKGAPLIVGKGDAKFSLCYIDNLTHVVYLASENPDVLGKAYNVSNGGLITWREFFEKMLSKIGKKQRVYVPKFAVFASAGLFWVITKVARSFDPPVTFYRVKRATTSSTYDISKTVADLGFQPDNDVDSQIESIVNWYMAEKNRDGR